jgi:predicted nucleotidyltransferase
MGATQAVLNQTSSPLLSLFYGNVDEAFYIRELMRTLGMGSRSVQKGIRDLVAAGLITRTKRNGRYFYQVNKESHLFLELRQFLSKALLEQAPREVRGALRPLKSRIRAAFVFGSVARNEARPDSDIDLMIVGDTSFKDVVPRLKNAEARLHREINPVIFDPYQFRSSLRSGNHFLNTVMQGKKDFLIGDSDELERLGSQAES